MRGIFQLLEPAIKYAFSDGPTPVIAKPHAHSTMAQTSITEDSIRAALTQRLKATHVEVQDMSGTERAPSNLCPDVMLETPRCLPHFALAAATQTDMS